MSGTALRLVILATLIALAGCNTLGPWGGPAYTLDTDKVGTGQSAISLRNDAQFWNGEPMDYRTRR